MSDANGLVETLKRAAIEAVDAKKPVCIYFGKVISASPLQINVEQKMTLGEKQLVLSRNVTDFKTYPYRKRQGQQRRRHRSDDRRGGPCAYTQNKG